MRGFSTSDGNECREAVVANSQRVAKEKEQARSNGSCPLEIQSKSSKGSWKKDGWEGKISHGQGILGVCWFAAKIQERARDGSFGPVKWSQTLVKRNDDTQLL